MNIIGEKRLLTEEEVAKLKNICKRRKWDIKLWARATGYSPVVLEGVINQEYKISQDNLNILFQLSREAKIKKGLMNFERPKIIVFWTNKGGTGKTSTAINTAFRLSSIGYSVAGIDADEQCDFSSIILPKYLKIKERNFYNCIVNNDDMSQHICPTNYDNLSLVPGSVKSEELSRYLENYPTEEEREAVIHRCMDKVFSENYYDFIIVDTDKKTGYLNQELLKIADYIIPVVETAFFSVKSLPIIINQVKKLQKRNPKLDILGVLFCRVNARRNNYMNSIDYINELLPGKLFDSIIRNDAAMENSQYERMPVALYNRKSNAAIDIAHVVDEVLNRIMSDIKGEIYG